MKGDFDMKFEACKTTIYAQSDSFRMLYDFMNSGVKCAKIDGIMHKTPESCAISLRRSAKYHHLYSVKAHVRKGEVYLVNTSID